MRSMDLVNGLVRGLGVRVGGVMAAAVAGLAVAWLALTTSPAHARRDDQPAPERAPVGAPGSPVPATRGGVVVMENARIFPVVGDPIGRGVLVLRDGKVAAIGAVGAVEIPAGATRIDLAGKTIIPGIVDTHSHVGGIGAGDSSATTHPDARVYDSINPLDPGFKRALAGGITTINVMPGSGHLLSGTTVYLKPRGGATVDDLAIADARGGPAGGVKMANGTNPLRAPPFTGTRGKSAAVVRQMLVKAQEYAEKVRSAGDDRAKLPPRDLGNETLAGVLDRSRIVHHHTHRADDVATVMRIAKEFNLRVVLQHVSEGYKVAGQIRAAQDAGHIVGCSVILVDSPGGKLETAEARFENAAILEKAGVLVAFHTDDWITDSRLFLRSAALGVRAGMSPEGALRAMTINGAKMLDLQARVGSLEVGKDADVVVLSGDPFSVYTKVEQTWVEGRKLFDRAEAQDRLWATGGFGAGAPVKPYLCCQDESEYFNFGRRQWSAGGR